MALNKPVPGADTISQLRLTRWSWLVAAVLILTGVWLHVSPFNAWAMLDVHQRDMGPDAFWSFATQFGDAGAAFLLLLVVGRFAPSGASLAFKCLLLGSLISRLLKTLVASPRPLGVLDPSLLHAIGDPPSAANSMPSGHAMTVAAMVGLCLFMFPKLVSRPVLWLPLVLFGVLVAMSRVVVGAHWPADVLVGAGLGLAVAWLAWQWDQLRNWTPRFNTVPGQFLLILIELGLAISLYASQTDTEAARLAFDVIATVGMAGAMARYANLRRQQAGKP